nr:MAG TPA: hypothetical protein [Caudoviricetes sp.]DAN77187.1 MAG TPA: hypothetical protein [Caudoviricetes sp.]
MADRHRFSCFQHKFFSCLVRYSRTSWPKSTSPRHPTRLL